MGFLALILALLVEQGRPLRAGHPFDRALALAIDWVRRHTDAGRREHGVFGWVAIVVVAVGGIGLLHWGLGRLHPLLQLAFDVAVLYATLGFRRFSQAFTEIQIALAAADTQGARDALGRWIRESDPTFSAGAAPVGEVCRMAIAHALVAAHRHVFAPLLWYLLLPGPVGPVLYRVVEMIARRWGEPPESVLAAARAHDAARLAIDVDAQARGAGGEPYGAFAHKAYQLIDWLPLRLTAAGFAIVGNFEDAVYCWRGASGRPTRDDQRALVLAAGGGALGVRIADPELEADWARSEGGFDWAGVEADPSALRSAVGLVWRAAVLWLVIFGMTTVASWVG